MYTYNYRAHLVQRPIVHVTLSWAKSLISLDLLEMYYLDGETVVKCVIEANKSKSTNTHSAIEKQMKPVQTVSKETIKLCYIVNLTLINLRWMRSKYAQIDAYSFTNWLKVLTLIWFLVKYSVVKTSNAPLLLRPFPWVMMNSQLKMYTNTCNRIESNQTHSKCKHYTIN